MSENDVNLAALWVPVMASTAGLKEDLVKAGTEAGAAGAVAMKAAIEAASPFKGLGMQLSREMAAGVPEAQRSLGVLSGLFGKVGTGTALAVGGFAGFTAAVIDSTKAAGDFQANMERLVASAGESQTGLAQVSNGILKMAGDVGYSAQQLSEAMYTVEKAGFRAGTGGLDVLKAAAQGAKSENADLKEVISGLTTTMSDFHKTPEQAADVMSQMVAATGMAKTNFQEFSGALHSVEPIASAVGASLSDVYGSLAQITQSGTGAAQAAQNMARAYTTLSNPTQKMRDELGQLGLNATDIQQHLGDRGLAGTLQKIAGTIREHMNPQQQVMIDTFYKSEQASGAAQKMFDSMSPAVKAVAQQVKDGTLSFKEFRKTRGGLAVDQANELQQWLSLQNKVAGYSNALKTGQGDVQTFMQALALATGNQETARIALQLSGDATQATNDRIKEISQTTREHDGTVKGFNETQSTFNAKMADFKAALGAARIELGEAFLPAMTAVAGALKDGAHWLSEHKTATEGLVIGVGALSTAYLTLKGALGFKKLIDDIGASFGKVNTAGAEANTTTEASGASAQKGAAGVKAAAAEEVAAEEQVATAAGEADAALAGGKVPPTPVPNPSGGGSSWFKNMAGVLPQALVGLQLGDDMRQYAAQHPADVPANTPQQAKDFYDRVVGHHAAGGSIVGPGPKGKDSVLSWLAPGEHVLTASDVDALGGQSGVYALRKALHRARGGAISASGGIGDGAFLHLLKGGEHRVHTLHRQGGGEIPHFDGGGDFGAAAGHPTVGPPDENALRAWVQQNFGIPNTFGTGSWENASHNYDGGWHHPGGAKQGYGFDFHGTPEQMDALANWVAQNYADKTLELIHQGPGFSDKNEIKNGKFGDVYGAGLNAEHRDHVHWAMTAAPTGTASNPLYTTHSRETADRADARVQHIEQEIKELKPDAKQSRRDELDSELKFAKEDQARAHAQVGMPGGRSGSGDSKYESAGQQFSSGLINGALSDLGFGNVLGGKSPLEWPLVKLFTGIAGIGLNLGNTWAESKLSGGSPFGQIPGLNSNSGETVSGGTSSVDAALASAPSGGGDPLGALASSPLLSPAKLSKGWFGDGNAYSPLNAVLPNAPTSQGWAPQMPSYTGGPQIVSSSRVATVPQPVDRGNLGMAGNQGNASYHVDNSINVHGNNMTDPHQLAAPIHEMQNAKVYSRSQFGGLPMAIGPGGG